MKRSQRKKNPAPLPVLTLEKPTMNLSWLVGAWVMLMALGFMTLRLDQSLGAGNPVSSPRAAMTSVNAASLTGFDMGFARPVDFHATVQFTLAIETLTGTLMSLIVGGALLSRLTGSRHTEGEIAGTSLMLVGGSAILGILTLPAGDPSLPGSTRALYAAFAGLGALGNSGLVYSSNGTAPSFMTYLLLFPLGIVGAQGVVVILDLWKWLRFGTRPSRTTMRMLATTATIFLGSTLLLWLMLGGWNSPPKSTFLDATRLAINAPALGLPSDRLGHFPRVVPALVTMLIALGLGTVGTNGGLGLLTLVTLPRFARHKLLVGLGIFWGIVALATLLLLNNVPEVSADQVLLLTISAAFNSGVSHNPITIGGPDLFLLALLMIIGRLAPLAMLWWADQPLDPKAK